CHVAWIMVFVALGPPKRLGGSMAADSFLTTRTSPPTPCTAAPRRARHPAATSGAFMASLLSIHYCMDEDATTLHGAVNFGRAAILRADVSPDPHPAQQLDRGGAAGAGRRRPGRRADRAAGPGARRHAGRLLLALRRPARPA